MSQAQENTQSREIDFNVYEAISPENLPEGYKALDLAEFMSDAKPDSEKDGRWVRNFEINEPRIQRFEPINLSHKVGIYIGASPAIKQNWRALLKIDENFVIIACNTVLRFLLARGIKPDYVFAVEAMDHIKDDFINLDTQDLTLIASPFCSPTALNEWKGEIKFYIMGGGDGFQKVIEAKYEDVGISGGNVVSTSFCWAFRYLGIRHHIFCGTSFAIYSDYYHDQREKPNENLGEWKDKYGGMDIYGNVVNTTPSLTIYKTWLEAYTKYAVGWDGQTGKAGSFINATEDGILGVMPEACSMEEATVNFRGQGFRPKHIPWIQVAPLLVAINGHKLRIRDKEAS